MWQIKQTLPRNLKDNLSMKGLIDFVLVDFGSTDGLQEWIVENFKQEIKEGYLKYYYTEEMPYWHVCVAKNTAHVLSESDIVVNLDGDNYTGKDGGKFVLENMVKNGIHDTVIHQFRFNYDIWNGSYGRIALSRENFINIGGYDEDFDPMTHQDSDLLKRLRLVGINYLHLNNEEYNNAISNGKEAKIANALSGRTSEDMHEWNCMLAEMKFASGQFVANKGKSRIGIEKNIYKLE